MGCLTRTVFVVLPAYNEAPNIGAVLDALERTGREASLRFHAIVVNDGSRDSTSEVVRTHAATLRLTLAGASAQSWIGSHDTRRSLDRGRPGIRQRRGCDDGCR